MDSSQNIKNLTNALKDIQQIQIADKFELASEHIDDLDEAFDQIVSAVKDLASRLDDEFKQAAAASASASASPTPGAPNPGASNPGAPSSPETEQPYSQGTVPVDQPASGSTPEPTAEVKSAFENAPPVEPGVQPAPIGDVSPLTVDGVHPSNDSGTSEPAQAEKDKDMAHVIKSTDGVGPDITVWDGDDDHTGEPAPNGKLADLMINSNPDENPVTEESPDKVPLVPEAASPFASDSSENDVKTTDVSTASLKNVSEDHDETGSAVQPNKEETTTAGEEISDIKELNHSEESPLQNENSPLNPSEDSSADSKEEAEEPAKADAFPSADADEKDKEVAPLAGDGYQDPTGTGLSSVGSTNKK